MSPGLISRIRGNSLVELVLIVAVALGLALGIQAFLVKPYRIPSESMVPTLKVGQRVLVNRLSHKLGAEPDIGDVVVFNPPIGANDNRCGDANVRKDRESGELLEICTAPVPKKAETNFIKRVVAKGGDKVYIKDGYIYRQPEGSTRWLPDPFLKDRVKQDDHRYCGSGGICNLNSRSDPATIKDGYFFMMGDNRGASDDSRYWGPVPRDWIIGGAFATYWPPKRIGIL